MRIITGVLLGILGAEVAWNWYTVTAMTFGQQIELLALAFITALCVAICLVDVPHGPEVGDSNE